MGLAKMVREARTKAGLSQSALAQRLSTSRRPGGVWPTYVGQIEKGDKVPSDEVCLGLAKALGLSPEQVLLAAYADRAECKEARHLFARMQELLVAASAPPAPDTASTRDRDLLKLAADPEVRSALQDPDVCAVLRDPQWRVAMGRAHRMEDGRPVLAVLSRLEGLSPPQWKGLMVILEGMEA